MSWGLSPTAAKLQEVHRQFRDGRLSREESGRLKDSILAQSMDGAGAMAHSLQGLPGDGGPMDLLGSSRGGALIAGLFNGSAGGEGPSPPPPAVAMSPAARRLRSAQGSFRDGDIDAAQKGALKNSLINEFD